LIRQLIARARPESALTMKNKIPQTSLATLTETLKWHPMKLSYRLARNVPISNICTFPFCFLIQFNLLLSTSVEKNLIHSHWLIAPIQKAQNQSRDTGRLGTYRLVCVLHDEKSIDDEGNNVDETFMSVFVQHDQVQYHSRRELASVPTPHPSFS
jgi:hypothetical protein